MQQQTLLIMKPDVYEKKIMGQVLEEIEKKFNITRLKMLRFSRRDAERFYGEHQGKPFFDDLINYITRNRIVAILLEGEDIINKVREFIGSTNPTEAEEGTLRQKFGTSLDNNVVHASDSLASAKTEIPFFFKLFDPKRQDNNRYGQNNRYGGQDNSYGGQDNRYGGNRRGNSYGGQGGNRYGGQDNRYGGNRRGNSNTKSNKFSK